MKVFKKNHCPEEWILQAFLDGELDQTSLSEFNNHLQTCNKCNERIDERRMQIQKVLQNLELSDSYHLTNKVLIVKSRNKRRSIQIVAWASLAASALILISLFTLFFFPSQTNSIAFEQSCVWVEVEDIDFQPEFVSPNRLYQMRVIEIVKQVDEGEYSRKILVKECNFQEVNN